MATNIEIDIFSIDGTISLNQNAGLYSKPFVYLLAKNNIIAYIAKASQVQSLSLCRYVIVLALIHNSWLKFQTFYSNRVTHNIIGKCLFAWTKRIELPLEASDVSQGNSHQSEKQEDPHVRSEVDLTAQQHL